MSMQYENTILNVMQETKSTETELKLLLLTAGDCAKLMPDGSPDEARRSAEFQVGVSTIETLVV